MNYMTTAEASKKWGITTGRITTLAQGERIPGARLAGHQWMIPENAEKPADARTKAGKAKKAQPVDSYRFPSFEYRSLSSFHPPLNEEELTLKAATEAFYACRYKDAERILGTLAERTEDRYRRISALFTGCMIDVYLCNTARFYEHYGRLVTELDGEFPHKAEMMEYLHEIEASLGFDTYYAREFFRRTDYEYHESFLPRLANLGAVSIILAGASPTASELAAHELNCIFLKNSEAYADLVPLHLYLGIAYAELGDSEKQNYHLRKALGLAEKYEEYFSVTMYYYYMRKLFKTVMREFPEDFRKRIEKLAASDHSRFVRFADTMSMNSIYKLLPHSDYIFLHYAVQGLTNKEIAARLHISMGSVGKKFGEIYTLLGVKNKTALVELYKQSIGGAMPEK